MRRRRKYMPFSHSPRHLETALYVAFRRGRQDRRWACPKNRLLRIASNRMAPPGCWTSPRRCRRRRKFHPPCLRSAPLPVETSHQVASRRGGKGRRSACPRNRLLRIASNWMAPPGYWTSPRRCRRRRKYQPPCSHSPPHPETSHQVASRRGR